MIRYALAIAALLVIGFAPSPTLRRDAADGPSLKVGSKKFTESVVLGEMIRLLATDAGAASTHIAELGGTKLVLQALDDGEIDVYPEYTGTIAEEIFAGRDVESIEEMRAALAERGIAMSAPLGFNNTYALGLLRQRAEGLGVEKISDLRLLPDLQLGFAHEFLDRADGWTAVRDRYALPHRDVSGLDHDLAYEQLKRGEIDVMEAYATDAKIALYDLTLLEDDLGHFPRYDAVLLYRADLAERAPAVLASIERLVGAIDESAMAAVNRRVVADGQTGAAAAAEFLSAGLGVSVEVNDSTITQRIVRSTVEHLDLVRRSLVPAILLAVPLGVLAAKSPSVGRVILSAVGVVQTIPALALLVMLMPVMTALSLKSVGQGSATAIVALMLYSLLPIVRGAHAGLVGIAPEHRTAAAALGLPASFRLLHVELPLASRSILNGIKTAAVINVGFATLGALIGAGGYGQPILSGIRLNDTQRILEGALPAAVLALVVQAAFDLLEKAIVPKGLQIKPGH